MRGAVRRLARLATRKRLAVWGTGLLGLSWFIYIYTMSVPGFIDRAGRVKGSDYVQFYVMGSLVLDGRPASLYDPAAHLSEGRLRVFPELNLYAMRPNYGPEVALAFAPLALLPYLPSLAVFLGLMALCYAGAVGLLWRDSPGLAPHGWLVALLAAASPLLFASLRYAQTSPFSLLLWVLAFVALEHDRRFAAGLAIGLLAYKPQFGLIVGPVLLIAREWRLVAGAAAAVALQLAGAWLMVGTRVLDQYVGMLWTLLRNPRLVEIYPIEIHSVRGFLQLLLPWPGVITVCYLAALAAILVAAVRCWRSRAPRSLKWAELVLLTVLASPHLVTYDLLLLTVPLVLLADWAVRNAEHPRQPAVVLLLVLAYFASFSGSLVARFTHVQASVIVLSMLAWQVLAISASRESAPADAVWRLEPHAAV
ncbi:MAG: glycosyltransferase family 87 protein [Betaproteobacteria bacterium]